jgi:hypothetical protein
MALSRQALLAFEDDRREKALRDEREALARRTAEAATSHHTLHETQIAPGSLMETAELEGHVLGERPGARSGNATADTQNPIDETENRESPSSG